MNATFLTVLVLALSGASLAGAQDKAGQPSSDPELSALEKQNAVLEERIKLLTHQQQLEKLNNPDPVTKQNELLTQRLKLISQEQSLLKISGPQNLQRQIDGTLDHRDDTAVESSRIAYTSLAGIAPEVAKALSCGGKNVVLYGPSQSETLLSMRAFNDQLDLLRTRLKGVLDLHAPSAPDQPAAANTSVYGVAALSGPVLQSVLDLISLFHANTFAPNDIPVDESGLVAVIANAAIAQGCMVYWPDQYVANPFNADSQVMAGLQSLATLNDNGGLTGKPPGLQQRLRTLETELKRSENMSQALSQKIEKEQSKLPEASKRMDLLRSQIDFLSTHIKDERNAALQDKLNKTFEKSWEELEAAIKRQMGSGLPGTIEEQGRLGEMSKRLDLLKTRTDWLSQYVKDEKDLALQDKLKRVLTVSWDQLEASVKNLQGLMVSVPQAIEPDLREQRRWDKYSADLKELISTTTAASEAYTTFRGALLDGSSGISPLSRMLRAEALRELTFDEKFQARAGSSIVQLKLQKLTGSRITKTGFKDTESFTGGVVLSFVQYEPNGKLKNSGVHTAYAAGFRP